MGYGTFIRGGRITKKYANLSFTAVLLPLMFNMRSVNSLFTTLRFIFLRRPGCAAQSRSVCLLVLIELKKRSTSPTPLVIPTHHTPNNRNQWQSQIHHPSAHKQRRKPRNVAIRMIGPLSLSMVLSGSASKSCLPSSRYSHSNLNMNALPATTIMMSATFRTVLDIQ